MILKRVICQIFLTTAITGLLMIWTECNSIQAKPLMINNNGITRITLKSLGIILEQQWEPLFGDTIFEEDSYYYSKVYKIGSSSDDSSSGTLYIVSTIFSGADKGENVGLPMRHYLFGYKDSLYYCGNSNKIQGLTGTFPVFQNIAEKMKKRYIRIQISLLKSLRNCNRLDNQKKNGYIWCHQK